MRFDDIPRPVLVIAAILILGLFLMFSVRSCQTARTAKTEAKVSKGQAGAAIESGRDAVNTVGNRAAEDARTDDLTRRNEDEIRNAEGADAPVANGARDAGLRALCRRAAYRGKPECVQHPTP